MSKSLLYRRTAGFVHGRSRVSMIAAAAGVLGAVGLAAGAASWAAAVGNVAKTEQSDSPTASGQLGASFFPAITGTKGGETLAGGQPDAVRSAATTGNAGHAAAAGHTAAAQPYRIYDSVKPEAIPSGKAAAVYANGAYAAFPRQLAGHNSVLWIDTNGSDPAANVLDVEPGDATPAGAAQWVKHRLSSRRHSIAIVYTMRSEWQQVKDNVSALPGWMQAKVRYWIADPTGVDHVVPGASATQWYWGSNYDITTANPNFVR